MKIWVHTLVKNESRWIWFAVTSVIDHVDKLLLWDTGSTDDSLEIIKILQKKYPGKIDFKQRKISSSKEFRDVRQEMLNITKSDWFIVLDGDEVWWEDSIKKLVEFIRKEGNKYESIVVPTINLIGDIFYYQSDSAGRYKFGNLKGHYNLRAIKRAIPGLHSEGIHGVWGWADNNNKQIQDRKTFGYVNVPYLHATNVNRSIFDKKVIKRNKKLKYEIGIQFPKDYYYPEAFFKPRPTIVDSPWKQMGLGFKLQAYIETPLRIIKRKIWKGKPGY